jgi:hypothetical protein
VWLDRYQRYLYFFGITPDRGALKLARVPSTFEQVIDADAQLPNGQHVLHYGPMLHEHLLADGGLEVPFLLSQLFPVYNVHHHSYRITVAEGSACPH